MGPAVVALAAYQAWAGMQAAETNDRMGKIQQSVNELDAKYLEIDAFNQEAYGASEVAAYEPNIDKTVNDQRAEFAAKDVDLNYGTAQQIQDETRSIGFNNKIQIQTEAHQRALGIKQQAANLRTQGRLNSLQTSVQSSSMQAQGLANAASTGVRAYERT